MLTELRHLILKVTGGADGFAQAKWVFGGGEPQFRGYLS